MSTKVIREHKAAATTAGILYITGTVAGVLSMAVTAPLHATGDPLGAAVAHPGTVVTGALLVLVMGLSLGFVPVVLFGVLRPAGEMLAIGYLIMRGAVETMCYIILALGLLLLVPLAEAMAAGPGTASPVATRLGSLLSDADATNAVLALVFCLGVAASYLLLYRSLHAPRHPRDGPRGLDDRPRLPTNRHSDDTGAGRARAARRVGVPTRGLFGPGSKGPAHRHRDPPS